MGTCANRASHNEEVKSCSYSLYNHVQELQKNRFKIYSEYFFCHSCKLTKRKELATKCVTFDTDIAMCNSWLLSALAGGLQEVSQKKTHMVSSRSDPVIVKEDWINDLMECALTLLARRGESLALSKSCEELRGTADYLEAVHNMDQEDIMCLMPKPRDLHNFCTSPCVAMEINSDSHLQRQKSIYFRSRIQNLPKRRGRGDTSQPL